MVEPWRELYLRISRNKLFRLNLVVRVVLAMAQDIASNRILISRWNAWSRWHLLEERSCCSDFYSYHTLHHTDFPLTESFISNSNLYIDKCIYKLITHEVNRKLSENDVVLRVFSAEIIDLREQGLPFSGRTQNCPFLSRSKIYRIINNYKLVSTTIIRRLQGTTIWKFNNQLHFYYTLSIRNVCSVVIHLLENWETLKQH